MEIAELPPQSVLRLLLRYDHETGRLFWFARPIEFFQPGARSAEVVQRCWNARNAGREALTTLSEHGYKQGRLFSRLQYAHRVAFKIYYGEDPLYIDHLSGDKADNRIANLRSVSNVENSRNQKRGGRNASGVVGVCFISRSSKWKAFIGVNNKYLALGFFDTFDEAVAIRKAAELEYGFHPKHGLRN